MRIFLAALMFAVLMVGIVAAVERMPIEQVDSDKLTKETQVTAPSDANNFNFVWWVPVEFWQAVLTQDASTDRERAEETLESLRPYAIIAVVMADVSPFGAFNFYSRKEVRDGMSAYYVDSTGSRRRIMPEDSPGGDIGLVLEMFSPMLRAAMGNMGENLHFFVVEDHTSGGGRLIDPYRSGKLVLNLTQRKGGDCIAEIPTPIDALFRPRRCPNGRDAHVSWKYCPWTGEKLPD